MHEKRECSQTETEREQRRVRGQPLLPVHALVLQASFHCRSLMGPETGHSQISQLHLHFLSFCNRNSAFSSLPILPPRISAKTKRTIVQRGAETTCSNIHVCFTGGGRIGCAFNSPNWTLC